MKKHLEAYEHRYAEVERLISNPDIHRDQQRYKELMQEHAHLHELIDVYTQYRKTETEIAESKALAQHEKDPDLQDMAKDEVKHLEDHLANLEKQLKILLVPRDPLDRKNIIMEIRAGTGGDEASLFAADLYRMYSRYAESVRWRIEVMSASPTEVGGFKEIVFSVAGDNTYGALKFESGVHRVQRVPSTESGGRIHTSAVTVAVLPEVEDTEVRINQEELRIDVYRSSGPGGQSVNTTDSAVRITHIPTGLVVTCQDEKSQIKNKAKALRILKARLYELEEEKKQAERASERRFQIGSGDRSERIRTYNFPQNRVTDHRINLTLYRLDSVLEGDLQELMDALKLSEQEALLNKTPAGA
jgi:peptide chain release factor 1